MASTSIDMKDDDSDLFSGKREPIDFNIYLEDTHPESNIHYMLRTVSYSGLLTLHSCPRKFELNRLTAGVKLGVDDDEEGHLDFGSVVGIGIQELLVSKDMNRALFTAFISWKDNIDSERGEKSVKTFWHALQAIMKFTEIMNSSLSQYEVATFNGKPAVELGFSIDCGDGFRYRGKLDALLIHKTKREFLTLECKTTGWAYLDEAMYMNSSQGIGYGVVIDRVAQDAGYDVVNSYDTFYPVYMTKKMEWVPFRFHKSDTQRALWLQNTILDAQDIQRYSELNHFPMRGESCFSYGRQCRWFGQCTLDNGLLIGNKEELPIKYDRIGEYPLEFSIFDLVEAQMQKE